jgi:hypothetical protein
LASRCSTATADAQQLETGVLGGEFGHQDVCIDEAVRWNFLHYDRE